MGRLGGSVVADDEGAGGEKRPMHHSHAVAGGGGGALHTLAAQVGTRGAVEGHVRGGDMDGSMKGKRAGNTAVRKSHGGEHQDGLGAVGGDNRTEGRDVLPRDVAHYGPLFPGKVHHEVRLRDSESRMAQLHPDV